MNHGRSRTDFAAVELDPPAVVSGSSARPPSTRDACPTKESSSLGAGLWGSRLGCRGGGSIGLDAPCRPADNPFASHRVEDIAYRYNGSGPANFCLQLQQLGGRAAIVGPKGSGKTTLLGELAAHLTGEPVLVRIKASSRRPWRSARNQLPNPVRPNHVILIDGAEQLGSFGWYLLLQATRHAGNLLATLHRPGLLPTLIECRTEPGLLRSLVEELVPADTSILGPELDDLFERHGGDIRLCFRELYDVYAGRRSFEF